MTVPSMGDVRGETKAFLQKADHVAVALFKIAKLFYGDEVGPRWFASLHKLASEKYGDNDRFTTFLKAALPSLQFVRNARNSVEHPDRAKSVKVTDIALLPSGELNPPSIEVIHPDTPQPSVPLLSLMECIADQLATVFEVMLAQLCGANVQPFAGMRSALSNMTRTSRKRSSAATGTQAGWATKLFHSVNRVRVRRARKRWPVQRRSAKVLLECAQMGPSNDFLAL
jgi:hypothetical protein